MITKLGDNQFERAKEASLIKAGHQEQRIGRFHPKQVRIGVDFFSMYYQNMATSSQDHRLSAIIHIKGKIF